MRGTNKIATVVFSAVALAFVTMAPAAAEENTHVLSTSDPADTAIVPDSDPWGASAVDSDPWGASVVDSDPWGASAVDSDPWG